MSENPISDAIHAVEHLAKEAIHALENLVGLEPAPTPGSEPDPATDSPAGAPPEQPVPAPATDASGGNQLSDVQGVLAADPTAAADPATDPSTPETAPAEPEASAATTETLTSEPPSAS